MTQRITDLRCREVINIRTGYRLGYVYDVLFDIESGKISSLVVPAQAKFFGIFGRPNDYIVPWECVKRVGDDIILIDTDEHHHQQEQKKKRRW
ncbi:MAG: YlmC/YmxH family sporulation protein [Clostridiales bacterium]|nr:YlmC/YmxH family sporulation protein [Clostridiales bacterium]